MKTTSVISSLVLATLTAARLSSMALAQETTAPATLAPATEVPATETPALDLMAGMGHDRAGMIGPAAFDVAVLDADKDGSVTKAELDAYRAARTAEIDATGDGFLSPEELAAMQIRAFTARAEDMAAKMVAMMDTDNDGKLSAAEMAARPGPEMIFDKIDADANGAVTQAEVDAAKASMIVRAGDRGGKHGGGKHGGGHRGGGDGGDDDRNGEGDGWGNWFGWGDAAADGN